MTEMNTEPVEEWATDYDVVDHGHVVLPGPDFPRPAGPGRPAMRSPGAG